MPPRRHMLLCICFLWLQTRISNCANDIGQLIKNKPNTLTGVTATCSIDKLDIQIKMEKPFHGKVYSKGFSLECKSNGEGDTEVTLNLQTSECGVKIIPTKAGGLSYVVSVEVQMDQYLQQIADQQRTVECSLPLEKLIIFSPALILRSATPAHNSARIGRKKSDIQSTDFKDTHSSTSRDAVSNKGNLMAWMEIKGSSSNPGYVTVGENTMMLIKTKLPDRVDFSVVGCIAHDGAADASQRLLDNDGCPIEEQILPAIQMITKPHTSKHNKENYGINDWLIAENKLQVAGAMFSAFKFPDRDSLHIRCSLQICRSYCEKIDCTQNENERNISHRTGRNKGENGEILDVIEVFNSVEVFAPGIELEDLHSAEIYREPESQSSGIALMKSEKTFCMSTPKMALAFGILGLVFLCAVAVALCTLMKGRRSHYHRKMMFGSEDTLIIQDSPFLRPRLQWPYVRVLR